MLDQQQGLICLLQISQSWFVEGLDCICWNLKGEIWKWGQTASNPVRKSRRLTACRVCSPKQLSLSYLTASPGFSASNVTDSERRGTTWHLQRYISAKLKEKTDKKNTFSCQRKHRRHQSCSVDAYFSIFILALLTYPCIKSAAASH